MSLDGGRVPDTTPAQPERSDATADAAVDRAASGRPDAGTLRDPQDSSPGSAPVEQVRGDEAMTQGRPAAGGDTPGHERRVAEPAVPPEEAAVSGGAQSDPGARSSDRTAADQG